MRIKKGFRLAALLLILVSVFAVLCAADGTYEELYPTSDTGAYNYTYTEASPGASYLVYMLAGTYADSETPSLSAADSNVLYYNHVRADENGNLNLSFVPMRYMDATVFLSSVSFQTPKILFYAKAGEALDVADFTITLDAEEYVLSGGSATTYVRYYVKAVDSFGFASKLPSFASREIADYDGDKISFLSGNAIALSPSLEQGVYTLAITCGDITRTANIVVKHAAAVPFQMRLDHPEIFWATGFKYRYFLDSTNLIFVPEYLLIEAQTLDQYGEPMEDRYTCTYVPVIGDVEGKPQQLIGTDAVQKFYPPEIPDIGQELNYRFTVTSSYNDPSSSDNSSFSYSFDITVVGKSAFEGMAQKLFENYLKAKVYIDRLDREDIVIATSSAEVPQSKTWSKKAPADRLRTAYEQAQALLELHRTTPQADSTLSSQDSALTSALSAFERGLLKGSYAIIEKLAFADAAYSIPLGETKSIAVTATPVRPSEKILYTSENTEIATVDNSGTVQPIAVGTTRITASNTDGSISAYYDLTVYQPITSVSFAEKEITLVAGETITPVFRVYPEDHGDTYSFSSANTKIVRVDAETGKLLALAEGTAVITLKASGKPQATLTVNVVMPTFAGSTKTRTKRSSEFTLSYTVNNAYHFGKMTLTAVYDADVFTLKSTESTELSENFTGTDTETAGNAVSTWTFDTPYESAGAEIVTYTFTTAENASYANHNIRFVFQAQTPDGADILVNDFEKTAVVTVGETSTYHVSVIASGYGTVEGGGDYEYGEQATLTATPERNYTLSGWYVSNKLVYSELKYTFTVTDDITVTAKFVKKTPSGGGSTGGGGGTGGGGSTGGSGAGSVTKLEQVKPVTCDTPSGLITPGTKVTLSCATVGAVIYYTLDGTPPTGASIRYTEPIEITQNGTQIRAVAIKNGMTNSEIIAFNFRFPDEEPTDPGKEPDEPAGNAVVTLKENAAQIKYLAAPSSYIRPNDPASRYEVVDMLAKLFDITGVTAGNRFADVSENHKSTVELFAAAGIINGYEDGTFGGAREITRAELVKIISLLLGLDKTEVEGESAVALSDISGHWAESNIRKFVAKGYILGYPEGDFRPDKAVSRAEAVTIINRVTGLVKVSGLPERFRDLTPDFWGYDEIMNAVEPQA